jgi:hypothetical protein
VDRLLPRPEGVVVALLFVEDGAGIGIGLGTEGASSNLIVGGDRGVMGVSATEGLKAVVTSTVGRVILLG